MFEVYATTPERMSPAEIGAHAKRAEKMGFNGLHVPDAIHDGLLMANNALLATTRLKVGTGVLVAFPRSPMNVAIAAWDLQAQSNGRFELGLGSQIKANIEKRYSTPWTSPVPTMREYMQSLREIFEVFQKGGKLNFVGKHYQFTKLQPFFNPGPIEHPDIPLLMGAIGPKMTELAGKYADGMITHPTNTPPRYIKEVCLPRLQEGADKVGRDLTDFKLMLGALIATGINEQVLEAERKKQRKLLGFLYSTPAYWNSLELFGWESRGEQLLAMTREGNWSAMTEIIDDEMLETFVPCGTYDEIVDLMKDRYRGLASRITFPIPENPDHDTFAAQAIARLQEN